VVTCTTCGASNPDGFRFCASCGAPLEAAPGSRRVVSILFCDVAGSTALGERLDAEALRRVMNRYHERARIIVERQGGTVRTAEAEAASRNAIAVYEARGGLLDAALVRRELG
jgi:class 3 adenylate cyclase